MTTPYQLHEKMISCRDRLLKDLGKEMDKRPKQRDTWIENEREAVAVAANQWATANGFECTVTVDHVERIETLAVGHVDYARKLCLYVAEFVVYGVEPRP